MAFAEQRVPTGLAAIVLATIPFWIILLTALMPSGEKPTRWTIASLVPGFIGVSAIAWKTMTTSKAGASPISILLLVISAIAWAFGTVVATRRKTERDSFSFAGMELLFGALALGAVSLARSEPTQFYPRKRINCILDGAYIPFNCWNIVAFGAYIWLLQTVAAPLVATYTFVNPIVAVFLGWLLLHEQLTWASVAGLGLVTVSVIWLSQQKKAFENNYPTHESMTSESIVGARGIDRKRATLIDLAFIVVAFALRNNTEEEVCNA